jgi:hypothetical protein
VYVVPEFRLVYVSVAKNACTTLKWAVAELAREDTTAFHAGLRPYVSDEHAVHARSQFKLALHPDEVDSALRAQIHPDNGWFIFGVVRDPRVRLFSAWQDKLLMQAPAYRWLRDEPWYPNIPNDADEIVADFARFVGAAASDPEFRLLRDTHFRSQKKALLWGAVPYSRIYPIEALDELRGDLERHTKSLGWDGPLHFRRGNETPLKANSAVFADGVREKIENIYATDFECFGEFWDFARISAVPEWDPATVHEVRSRAELGRRVADVRQIALHHRKRANREAKRADEAVSRLERELSASRHPGARFRRVLGHARRRIGGRARAAARRLRLAAR